MFVQEFSVAEEHFTFVIDAIDVIGTTKWFIASIVFDWSIFDLFKNTVAVFNIA